MPQPKNLPVIVVPNVGHGGRAGDAVKIGTAPTIAAAKALARKAGYDVAVRGKRFHGRADWSSVHPDVWMVTVSGKKRRPSPARKPNALRRGAAGMDRFTRAYVNSAMEETNEDDGQPYDRNYKVSDIDPMTLVQMRRDAASFQRRNADDLAEVDDELAGYLFWHNRNGSGVGFWDGRLPRETGKRLSDAAHAFSVFDLYIGDDGQIHGTPLGRKSKRNGAAVAKWRKYARPHQGNFRLPSGVTGYAVYEPDEVDSGEQRFVLTVPIDAWDNDGGLIERLERELGPLDKPKELNRFPSEGSVVFEVWEGSPRARQAAPARRPAKRRPAAPGRRTAGAKRRPNGWMRAAPSAPQATRRQVVGTKELGRSMRKYARGEDAVYSVSMHFKVGNPVKAISAQAALEDLQARRAPAAVTRPLAAAIARAA